MKKIIFSWLALLLIVPNISLAESDDPACNMSYPEPVLSGETTDSGVLLSWEAIDNEYLEHYKVVISQTNTHPQYGDSNDGYLMYIIDEDATSYLVNNSQPYKNGDFGEYLTPGETYHFRLVAAFECSKKTSSNPVTLTFSGTEVADYGAPDVSASSTSAGITLSWTAIDHDDLEGYKIIGSKRSANIENGSDGHLLYFVDEDASSVLLNNSHPFRGGDINGYLKVGEDYYFIVRAVYKYKKVNSNTVSATYNGPASTKPTDEPTLSLEEYDNKASLLKNNKTGDILQELEELRDTIREQQTEIKYLRSLLSDLGQVLDDIKQALNDFITYGVDENTQSLGAGERAAVIYSYKSAFDKLPETEDELADAIRIANGRWPEKTNTEAENRAKASFRTVYQRDPDMDNPNDNAAVTVMAYGLRQKAQNRNLNSERNGINIFKGIFGRLPESTEDWNIMQAITYSGATR